MIMINNHGYRGANKINILRGLFDFLGNYFKW